MKKAIITRKKYNSPNFKNRNKFNRQDVEYVWTVYVYANWINIAEIQVIYFQIRPLRYLSRINSWIDPKSRFNLLVCHGEEIGAKDSAITKSLLLIREATQSQDQNVLFQANQSVSLIKLHVFILLDKEMHCKNENSKGMFKKSPKIISY